MTARLRVLRAYPRNNQKTAIQFVSLRAQHTATVVPVSNTQHRSGVFESFVDLRAEIICERLHLDPATLPVHRAVQALAERMAATQRDVLEREDARTHVDAFAPGRTEHPNPMLAQLSALTGSAVVEDFHGVAPGPFQVGDFGVDAVDHGFQAPSFAVAGGAARVVGV